MSSGLSKFSTLQGFASDTPIKYQPSVPTVQYDGSISDNSAVEAWVLKQVAQFRPGEAG